MYRTAMIMVTSFFWVGFSLSAHADQYVLEKPHTQILFFCDHLGFSKSQGEFLDFSGHFKYDPEKIEDASVKVTIKTASISMDDGPWDDHVKNEDFFHVEEYPTMTFVSTSIEPLEGKKFNIHGNLTLLGQTKPVVLNAKHNKSGVHPFSKDFIAGFSATTTVKRSEFGMEYGLPMIGDDIEVRLEVEGIRQ